MTVSPLPADFAPGKILALHLNYASRIAQRGRKPGQRFTVTEHLPTIERHRDPSLVTKHTELQ